LAALSPIAIVIRARFARFEDDHNLVGLRPIKIRLDEFVATALWRRHSRDASLRCPVFQSSLKLFSDVAKGVPRDASIQTKKH
jgi:hypothetical protein